MIVLAEKEKRTNQKKG